MVIRLLITVAHDSLSKAAESLPTTPAEQEVISPKAPAHHICPQSQLVPKAVFHYIIGTETLLVMLSAV